MQQFTAVQDNMLCLQTGTVELGLRAWHKVTFADDDLRIFQTNAGNFFATVRD
jgi:hypothetical protein